MPTATLSGALLHHLQAIPVAGSRHSQWYEMERRNATAAERPRRSIRRTTPRTIINDRESLPEFPPEVFAQNCYALGQTLRDFYGKYEGAQRPDFNMANIMFKRSREKPWRSPDNIVEHRGASPQRGKRRQPRKERREGNPAATSRREIQRPAGPAGGARRRAQREATVI